MTRVKVTASRGTNGKAATVPSALAMARLWRDGVGEKGRRAWPPRSDGGEDVGKKRHGEWGFLGVFGERVKG